LPGLFYLPAARAWPLAIGAAATDTAQVRMRHRALRRSDTGTR